MSRKNQSFAASLAITLLFLVIAQAVAAQQAGKEKDNGADNGKSKPNPKGIVVPYLHKAPEQHTFYQQIIVTQKPSYNIQGLTFQSQLRYSILSQFTIKKKYEDGRIVLVQTVLGAQLNQADQLTKPLLMPAIQRLQRSSFLIMLNKNREVIGFQTNGYNFGIATRQFGAAQGLQVASLLDKDGWKELIEASFFFPDDEFFHGKKWVRRMSHSWGPLGSWQGLVGYAPAGRQNNIHRIAYTYKMAYRPPRRGGRKSAIQISNAQFQPQQSQGFIYFDADKGRVSAAEEYFRVRGRLSLNLLGRPTPVMMEEEQVFQIRITEENPLVKRGVR